MSSSIIRKVNGSNDTYDKYTTATNTKIFSVGVEDTNQDYIINLGEDSLDSNSGADQALKITNAGTINLGHNIDDGQTINIGKTASTGITLTPSGTASSENITVTNGAGDAADAIHLNSVAGGITLTSGNATHGVIVSDNLNLKSDSAVLGFGADSDVTLTHAADTGLLLNAAMQLQFRDSSIHISSDADGYLSAEADTGVNLNIGGTDKLSITSATSTFSNNVVIPDAGTIGSASDADAISISAGGVIGISATTASTSASSGALTVGGGAGIAGDLFVGDDLSLISDGAILNFGADKDVKITHVADSGLTLKNTSTGDDTPFVLTLQTGEIDMQANDVIATINFQAPDEGTGTDSILVAAGIDAVAEGDFSASSNATKLSFKTAASEAAAEKMSLSSTGVLTLNGASGSIIIPDAGTIGSASDTNAISISAAGVIGITSTTASSSATTGALTVAGGAGIAADLFVGDDLSLISDGAILNFGADSDVNLTHVADTGLLLNDAMQLQFRDSAIHISSDADGYMNIQADTGININIGGTDELAITATTATFGTNIVIPDAGTIGSASDTDAISISAGGIINISATTASTSTTSGALTVGGGVGIAADLFVGDDLSLISDGAILNFGADSDVTVTHVADSGLTFKNTSTGDDTPFVLTLQTGETNMEAGDILGTINFQAPDEGEGTDAILVAAGIDAVSEGDFSAASNATKLSFKTAASETASEKMSLSSTGVLTLNGVGGAIVIPDAGTIGSASDTDAISISAGGVVNISATTASTSATTGALIVAGGAGIAADLFVGDDLSLISDGAILNFGADSDVNLTHVADTGLLLNGAMQLQFRDSAIHISSDADGYMNVQADTGVNINIGGTDELAITATTATFGTNIVIPDTGTIGSASDTDAISISAGGVIAISATTTSTTATSGALIVAGGVGIAENLNVGNDLKLLSDSAVLAIGADSDVTITHDGGTGATLASAGNFVLDSTAGTLALEGSGDVTIKSDTGDINLESEGDIILEANGADVILKDNGTIFGSFSNSSGDLIIKSGTTTALTCTGADVAIAGSLTVNGNMTTVDVSNTQINDNMIILNTGISGGANANDTGILIDRGSTGNNGFMGFDESADRFVVALTDASDIETGNIVSSSEIADFQCSTLYVDSISDLSKISISGSTSDLGTHASGQAINVASMTYRDDTTASSNTNGTHLTLTRFNRPTLTAANSSVTTTNASTLYIANSPDAGSNQTITNAYSLYIASGNSRFDTIQATSVTTTSDISLKTNIKKISNALDKVNNMRGVYFDWKDQEKYGGRKQLGFIAQEVESVVPELVMELENDIKSVNYSQTVALLLEAIKDQNEIINKLKDDVEYLKTKIN